MEKRGRIDSFDTAPRLRDGRPWSQVLIHVRDKSVSSSPVRTDRLWGQLRFV